MGEKILERRLQADLTQMQVVEIVRKQGDLITHSIVSKVECGDITIGSDAYRKILKALS